MLALGVSVHFECKCELGGLVYSADFTAANFGGGTEGVFLIPKGGM